MGKNDAVMACVAQLAVPYKLPVIPLVTVKDPLIVVSPLEDTTNKSVDPLCIINKSPVRSSVTLNISPWGPFTDNIVEPELNRLVEPVTDKLPVISADPVYGNGGM
jgi:hypothetical protein